MKDTSKLLLKICIAGSIWFLIRGFWPGFLNHLNFLILLASIFIVPIMVICGLSIIVLAIARIDKDNKKEILSSLKYLAIGTGVLALTIMLLFFHIPIRSTFFITKGSFSRIVNFEDFSAESSGNQWVGIWFVDECKVDNNGGLYFRIGEDMDGIGPDTMSFGFAYKPNLKTSPFGGAGYELSKVSEDWYYFSVSDDHY